MVEKGEPIVKAASTFRQIAKDFTRPLDSIREAISNSIDARATKIYIYIWIDDSKPEGELVIDIQDDGDGMSKIQLEAFFNLGDSTRISENGRAIEGFIGEKGHGTKTFYNSREIEIYTKHKESGVKFYAIMEQPLEKLYAQEVPPYEYEENPSMEIQEGTKIVIRGFNNNVINDFSHRILQDYIIWFTSFANFSWIFEKPEPSELPESYLYANNPKIYLRGLGFDGEPEEIGYGHIFPRECTSLPQINKQHPNETMPMRWYVKRWHKKGMPVQNHPHVKLDVVFSLEGDLVRRKYNTMISYHGKKEGGDYTIEQRYGLWAAKDYIPVRQVNDWFSRGKSEWTKFHAFVNCQRFSLTANRADINNTDQQLLENIENTIQDYFENSIEPSRDYQLYKASVQEQESYRNARQEAKEFESRKKRALKKLIAYYNGVELISPGSSVFGGAGQELGVHCLFSQMDALVPDLFGFKVVDYDSHKGYDCLVSRLTNLDLNNPQLAFVEFKYKLNTEFNHSFEKLAYVVCWECELNDGTQVTGLGNEIRILDIFEKNETRDHTTFSLRALGQPHNIEVFVLKKFLKEKLGIEFLPQTHT